MQMSRVIRKLVFEVSDQVRHKPGCATTENGLGLEISDLARRGTCSEKKGADLYLCFHICKNRFSHDGTQIIEWLCDKSNHLGFELRDDSDWSRHLSSLISLDCPHEES